MIFLISLFLIFFLVFKYLESYTLHEKTIVVPDFNNLSVSKLDSFTLQTNLKYFIIDSVYYPNKETNIVVKQDPLAGINVKKDRVIYLYVTASLPPRIKMPKLQDKSLRQAIATLESYGLKIGKSIYMPDQCNNCILQQIIKGKKIEPGTMIEKGSVIDLVIGKGLSDEEISIPDLKGLTREEAKGVLIQLSLNEGSVYFEQPADTANAMVYKQIPEPSSMIKLGSAIDLFFSNKTEIFPLIDTTAR